jgi:outer membrane lipoprotein-sorting protein
VGQENLLDVETIVTKGTLRQGGLDVELTTFIKRPDKFRLEGRYERYTFVEVFDGEIGWTFNQMRGDEEPSLLADQELKLLKSQADIDGLLFNYRNKGFDIELLEPKIIGNILTNVIVLSKPDGIKITYNLDSETSVILKTTTIATIGGTERIYESIFRNYRYINQILFPFNVDVYIGGELVMEIEYDSIDLDKEIEDYRFATPQLLEENVESY